MANTVDKLLDYAPGAKVHAFEPTPQGAAILRQRMTKRPNVHVHEMALGDKTRMTRFQLNVCEQWAKMHRPPEILIHAPQEGSGMVFAPQLERA